MIWFVFGLLLYAALASAFFVFDWFVFTSLCLALVFFLWRLWSLEGRS